jgi:DNA-binding LacI/PurR family transcriptional regulator
MSPAPRNRTTLEDVASKAKVSRSTVSRVVRRVPGVDPEIVSRVNAAIAKTGYQVNRAARSLAGGATHNIAIIFREDFGDIFMNGYWGQVLEGVHEILQEEELQTTILINHGQGIKQLPQYLLNGHVDGAIFLGTSVTDKLPLLLQRNNIPVVVFGDPYRGREISRVMGEEILGGEIAAQELLDSGCKEIGLISGSEEIATNALRIEGFTVALRQKGFKFDPKRIVSGGFTQRGGYEAMHSLIQKFPKLDGIFILSDLMAIGALEKLSRLKISVPDEISVIGFDNSPSGNFSHPRLTTIDTQPRQCGVSLAQMLLQLISGSEIRSVMYPPKLVSRESTKASRDRKQQ